MKRKNLKKFLIPFLGTLVISVPIIAMPFSLNSANEPEISNISNVSVPQPLNLDSRSLRYNDHYLTRPLKDWETNGETIQCQSLPSSAIIDKFEQPFDFKEEQDEKVKLFNYKKTHQLQFSPISIDWEKLLPNRTDLSKQELAKLYLPFVIFTPKIKQQLTLSKTIDDQVIDGKQNDLNQPNPLEISLPFSFPFLSAKTNSTFNEQEKLISSLELDKYFKSSEADYSNFENITFDEVNAIMKNPNPTEEEIKKIDAFYKNAIVFFFTSQLSDIKWTLNSYGDLVLDLTTTTNLQKRIGSFIELPENLNNLNLKEVSHSAEHSIADLNYTRKNIIGFTQSIIDFLNENKITKLSDIFTNIIPSFQYIYNSSSKIENIKQEVISILYDLIVSNYPLVSNFSKDLIFNDNFIRVDINSHSSSTIEFTLTPTIKDWNGASAGRNPITFNYTKPSLDDIDPNKFHFNFLNYSVEDVNYPVLSSTSFSDSTPVSYNNFNGQRTPELKTTIHLPKTDIFSIIQYNVYQYASCWVSRASSKSDRATSQDNTKFIPVSILSSSPHNAGGFTPTRYVESKKRLFGDSWATVTSNSTPVFLTKIGNEVNVETTLNFKGTHGSSGIGGSSGNLINTYFTDIKVIQKNPLPSYQELFNFYCKTKEFKQNFINELKLFLTNDKTKELLFTDPSIFLQNKVREIFLNIVKARWTNLKFVDNLSSSHLDSNYLTTNIKKNNNKLIISFNFGFTDYNNQKHVLSTNSNPIVFDLSSMFVSKPIIFNNTSTSSIPIISQNQLFKNNQSLINGTTSEYKYLDKSPVDWNTNFIRIDLSKKPLKSDENFYQGATGGQNGLGVSVDNVSLKNSLDFNSISAEIKNAILLYFNNNNNIKIHQNFLTANIEHFLKFDIPEFRGFFKYFYKENGFNRDVNLPFIQKTSLEHSLAQTGAALSPVFKSHYWNNLNHLFHNSHNPFDRDEYPDIKFNKGNKIDIENSNSKITITNYLEDLQVWDHIPSSDDNSGSSENLYSYFKVNSITLRDFKPAMKELVEVYLSSNDFAVALSNSLSSLKGEELKEFYFSKEKIIVSKTLDIIRNRFQQLPLPDDYVLTVNNLLFNDNYISFNFDFKTNDWNNSYINFSSNQISISFPNYQATSPQIFTLNKTTVSTQKLLSSIPTFYLMERPLIQDYISNYNKQHFPDLNSPHFINNAEGAVPQIWNNYSNLIQQNPWIDLTNIITNKPKIPELRLNSQPLNEVSDVINNYFSSISPLFATEYIYWNQASNSWISSNNVNNQIYFSPDLLNNGFTFKFDYRLIIDINKYNSDRQHYKQSGTLPLKLLFMYDTNTTRAVYDYIISSNMSPPNIVPPAPNQTYWHSFEREIILTGFKPFINATHEQAPTFVFSHKNDLNGKELSNWYKQNNQNAVDIDHFLNLFANIEEPTFWKLNQQFSLTDFNNFVRIFGDNSFKGQLIKLVNNLLDKSNLSTNYTQYPEAFKQTLENDFFNSFTLEIYPGFRDFESLKPTLSPNTLKFVNPKMLEYAGLKTVRLKYHPPFSTKEFYSDDIFLATKAPKYFINRSESRNNYIYDKNDIMPIKITAPGNIFLDTLTKEQVIDIVLNHLGSTYGYKKNNYGVNEATPLEIALSKPVIDKAGGTATYSSVKMKIKKNLYASDKEAVVVELLNPKQKLVIKCKTFHGYYSGFTTYSYTKETRYDYDRINKLSESEVNQIFKKWMNKIPGDNAHINFLSEFIPEIRKTDYPYQDSEISANVEEATVDFAIISFCCKFQNINQPFKIKVRTKNYWNIPPTNLTKPNDSHQDGLFDINAPSNTPLAADKNLIWLIALSAGSIVLLLFFILITFLVLKNKKWTNRKK